MSQSPNPALELIPVTPGSFGIGVFIYESHRHHGSTFSR